MPSTPSRTRGRSPERLWNRPRPLRWTHLFASLFTLTERARRPDVGTGSVADRRLQQRLALAQRLMEALPASLMPGTSFPDRFWRSLRWGGVGMLLARLLS